MNEINKRIQIVLHKFASTRIQFCNTTCINPFHLKQIFKEQREISYNHIYMICRAYPQLNVEWLITGKGKILNNLEKDEYNLFKINVKITKNRKLPLKVLRNHEFHYRQAGMLLREKVELCQMKSKVSEERAFSLVSYSYTRKMASDNKTIAFELYKSIYSEYLAKVPPESYNMVVAFHLAYKYYCANLDKNVLN